MKRFLALLLAVALLLTVTACTGDPQEGDTTTTTTESTTTAPTTAPTVAVPAGYNPLTGEYDMAAGSSTRPVAIMVPNDSMVIGHQIGIDKADFIMECETEGAIPRLMTVFASSERIPSTYGPIRSARSPFVATAKQFGLIYTYSGATTHVKNNMVGLDTITNNSAGGLNACWRDAYLTQAVTNYHNLVTSGEKMTQKIQGLGYSTSLTKELPFTFGEKSGDGAGNKVQLNTTPSHRATFIYDSETGLYGKNIGKMESCKPHVTKDGDQIKVSNVLVLYAEKYVENKNDKTTWYNFREGEGTGYLISGGTSREIKFNRTATELTLTETDGTPLIFATGKTYMVLADKTLSSKIIFK